MEAYDIEIGGGLGDLAGKIWRIGLMGESSTKNHVNMLLSALKTMIEDSPSAITKSLKHA